MGGREKKSDCFYLLYDVCASRQLVNCGWMHTHTHTHDFDKKLWYVKKWVTGPIVKISVTTLDQFDPVWLWVISASKPAGYLSKYCHFDKLQVDVGWTFILVAVIFLREFPNLWPIFLVGLSHSDSNTCIAAKSNRLVNLFRQSHFYWLVKTKEIRF